MSTFSGESKAPCVLSGQPLDEATTMLAGISWGQARMKSTQGYQDSTAWLLSGTMEFTAKEFSAAVVALQNILWCLSLSPSFVPVEGLVAFTFTFAWKNT